MLFGIGKLQQTFLVAMLGLFSLSIACAQSQQAKLEESHKHEEKALELRLKRDFHGALQEQLKAVELNPNDSEPLTILGGIYQEIYETEGKPEYLQKAKEALQRAVKADPNDDVAHDMLAATLLQLGDKQNSLRERKEAVRLKPINLRYITNVGVTQENLGENQAARKTYESVLQKNFYYIYALYRLGELENEEGNYDKAVQLFERALSAKPTEADDEHFQETVKRRLGEIREQKAKENAKSVTTTSNQR